MEPTKNTNNNSNTGAYILIGIGSYFLLKKLGWIPNILPLIGDWWSVILIVIGIVMLLRNTLGTKE
jgi:Domain of unknown function (DUF5668)